MIINIVSILLGLISLVFALITFIKTESYKRRVKIEIVKTVADSHIYREEIMNMVNKDNLKTFQGRIDAFNHNIFVSLLSLLDKKSLKKWLIVNKKIDNKINWKYYEIIFQERLK